MYINVLFDINFWYIITYIYYIVNRQEMQLFDNIDIDKLHYFLNLLVLNHS